MPGLDGDYSYHAPVGLGGMPSVALDSKGNLWAFQRRAPGDAQLMKFGPDRKLILSVGDAIGHQSKAHGMAVDRDDTSGSPTPAIPPSPRSRPRARC